MRHPQAKFDSVLIANRGEIACRIIRSAKQQGYRTIAVYSDADQGAPHTLLADDAAYIGASPVAQSYLVMDKILQAAQDTGAQAIHPGYGFLSENAEFARACHNAGLVFIGPSAEAIELMGNKAQAKRRMLASNVPCVPGYEGEDQSDTVLIEQGSKIGFPIMVKAAAGGGGRGMRLVEQASGLADAIALARSEAENAFGSGELILEKAVIAPRHVEVQVFADKHGNTVHLNERDCSVQRRHQKVVEEAPCPIMSEELRGRMGAAAVAAAQSIDYVGAGTVEFLLDSAGEFYFLEMNTRLQVEHPVTEMITGHDLVALQLQVAQGEPLGFEQSDVTVNGHAIEVRLYSEDPANDFLPTSGQVSLWVPYLEQGVRVDDGIQSRQFISPFYDPMVAKVIAHGADRDSARRTLIRALQNTALFGIKNNKQFLLRCLSNETFAQGEATTAFIEQEFNTASLAERQPTLEDCALAAVLDLHRSFEQCLDASYSVARNLKNWSSTGSLMSRRRYEFAEQVFDLAITPQGDAYRVSNMADSERNPVTLSLLEVNTHSARVLVDDRRHALNYLWHGSGDIELGLSDADIRFQDQLMLAGVIEDAEGGGQITAPMHGMILDVSVKTGQHVEKGERLLVLEAMKMQHEILASVSGEVVSVTAQADQQVAAHDLLVEIEAD